MRSNASPQGSGRTLVAAGGRVQSGEFLEVRPIRSRDLAAGREPFSSHRPESTVPASTASTLATRPAHAAASPPRPSRPHPVNRTARTATHLAVKSRAALLSCQCCGHPQRAGAPKLLTRSRDSAAGGKPSAAKPPCLGGRLHPPFPLTARHRANHLDSTAP